MNDSKYPLFYLRMKENGKRYAALKSMEGLCGNIDDIDNPSACVFMLDDVLCMSAPKCASSATDVEPYNVYYIEVEQEKRDAPN